MSYEILLTNQYVSVFFLLVSSLYVFQKLRGRLHSFLFLYILATLIEARIMALADVFDALVSKRCYKESFSFDKAFGIIKESLGSHFDPELGRHFLEIRKELEEMYIKENNRNS